MARKLLNFPEAYDGDLFTLPDGSPRLWWVDIDIWKDRMLPEDVDRETAYVAEKHVFKQARALVKYKRWRNVLTGLERRVVELELDFMRTHRQPPPVPEMPKKASENEIKHIQEKRIEINTQWGEYYRDKWQWIAQEIGQGFTSLHVRSILDEASRIMADAIDMNNEEVIELVYARKLRHEERVEKPLRRMSDYELKQLAREVLYEEKQRAA